MLKALGKNPRGDHKKKVEASTNYQNGKFNNLIETPMLAEGASYLQMMGDFIKGIPGREPKKALPFIKTDLSKLNPIEISITWFGHSSYHIFINGKNLLVDPVLSGHASPFSNMVKAFEGSNAFGPDDFNTIDFLILTHDHYDHLDYKTLVQLKPKVKKIYCSLGVASHLLFWGFNPAIIHELDWWDSIVMEDDLKLTATPARHFSGRTHTRAKTLWSSFVLENQTHRLFLGGDSGYGEHFKDIGNRFKTFDIAILECGQYNQKWPFIHMSPEQTVQAHLDLKAKLLLPVHWGKFALAYHPWTEPIERLTKKADEMQVKYTTPMIGEPVILDSSHPEKLWWKEIEV